MIHLNVGSNLDSVYGGRNDNISRAINLLIGSKIKVKKISNFYETPSYPNQKLPKFLNVGVLVDFDNDHQNLLRITSLIEKKNWKKKIKKK